MRAGPPIQSRVSAVSTAYPTSCLQLVRRATNVIVDEQNLPLFATVDETANLLRTTRKAIYAMIERGQLPGVRRIGRRVLISRRELLHWLDHNCASSPKE